MYKWPAAMPNFIKLYKKQSLSFLFLSEKQVIRVAEKQENRNFAQNLGI